MTWHFQEGTVDGAQFLIRHDVNQWEKTHGVIAKADFVDKKRSKIMKKVGVRFRPPSFMFASVEHVFFPDVA